MLTKLFIFGLLCSTVLQAFPTIEDESQENKEESCNLPKPDPDSEPKSKKKKPNSTPVNQKIPCIDQIEWIKNTTLMTKKEYEKYYTLFTDTVDAKNLSTVKAEHEGIEKLIADSLRKYDIDLKNIRSNAQDQWKICRDELKSFSIMNRNLSSMAQSLRSTVIDYAKSLGLPPDIIDNLDRTLGRIVNYMFILDIGKNIFRDVHSMIKEAGVKINEGIKLEEKYKFTEEGVEAIGDLKEKEKIGHVEEPARAFLKPKKETEVVRKVKDITHNQVDWKTADDKEFDDLIGFEDHPMDIDRQPRVMKLDNEPHAVNKEPVYNVVESDIDKDPEFDNLIHDDQEIGNTNKQLQEREKQAKLADKRFEQRLRAERKNWIEDQEFGEKKASEIYHRRPGVIRL